MGQSPMAMLWFGVAVDPQTEEFLAFMDHARTLLPPEDLDEEEAVHRDDSEILTQLSFAADGEDMRYPGVEVVSVSDYCIAIGLRETRHSTDWDVRDLGESIETPEPCDVAPLLRFIKLLWPNGDGPTPSWNLVGEYS